MKSLIFLSLFLSQASFGFVLLDPQFELNDGTKAKVKVSKEGCVANGISDSKVASAIKVAVEFWNDVPESRLKLSYGGKSAALLTDNSIPKNEIIVGCGTLPSVQILGATQNDYTNGSARVKMNEAVYTGSYNEDSFVGTIIHEVGHGLGLFHSNDPASVMTYSENGWGDRPKYISQDDIDGVIYLYPNKSELGGLLGSCSSYAADKAPNFNFYWDFLLGFLAILGFSKLIQIGLKRVMG